MPVLGDKEVIYSVSYSIFAVGAFVDVGVHQDGLVHISALPADYYHFDPIAHSLAGERSGRKYFLGDRIRISVLSVNVDERKIDFDYVE